MAREQKTKSKGSQTRNARSKQGVAPAAATLVPNTTQTIDDTTSTASAETQVSGRITTTDTTTNATTSSQQEQGGTSPSSTVQESATSNQQTEWTGLQPSWPRWATSKPGSRSTPPAPGMRPINKFRPDQFEEVGYNQQTGEPAIQSPLRSLPDERTTGPTGLDQPTAQEVVGKRKQRL